MADFSPPGSILIIGSGVFGLSTALALAERDEFQNTTITVVDRAEDLRSYPARDASSVDSSRVIRADYSDPSYAALANEAQVQWRKNSPRDLGGEGRYKESGFAIVADETPVASATSSGVHKKTAMEYVKSSWANVVALTHSDTEPGDKIRVLPTPEAIRDAVGTGGGSGSWGYINRLGGWADADACMRWLYDRVLQTGRVGFRSGTVVALKHTDKRVTGATFTHGSIMTADLVVVSAGAWTGSLVDLAGQAIATGQVLGYLSLTAEEEAQLRNMPVLLNLSTGLFVMPPDNNRVLKVARHAYGYLNPTTTCTPLPARLGLDGPSATVSVPLTRYTEPDLVIPAEGADALRSALREMIPIPAIHQRPFTHTRLCWYTDTPTGDFLIDYHPSWQGLFLATGGSGHGFKFLPVLGEKIVDCIVGKCAQDLRDKWAWKQSAVGTSWDAVITEDGSRGGLPKLLLADELRKTRRLDMGS